MFLFAYYMANGDLKKAFVAALFVLSVREDAGLFFIAYALFDVLQKHGCDIRAWLTEKRSLFFAIMGAVWILVSVFLVIPHFNVAHAYPLFARYHPTNVRLRLFEISMAKLAVLFLSVAFIPLRRCAYWAPVTFLWLENALANKIQQTMIGFQYDYIILPMTFIVLVYALKDEEVPAWRLVVPAIISMLLFSPIFRIVNTEPVSFGEPLWRYLEILRGG